MNLGNAQKAAELIVLLGDEVAAGVLRHLNESEIEAIAKEISNVGTLASETAEKSAEELYQLLVANRFLSEGGVDYARKVILRTLGSGPARKIMDRLSNSYASDSSFQSIDKINPVQLSQFIQAEHPQTIALILAHLSARNSALLLGSLPSEIQAEVAVRMASLEEIAPDVIRNISTVLEEKLKTVGMYTSSQSSGGIRAVAEMFNHLDRQMSRSVLESIDNAKPEIANSIRQLMFIFEDIGGLDDLAIREILQRVDKKTIAQALKGTSEDLQKKFFHNMSSRAVEIMQEEMEVMGPIKAKDVNAAQQQIVDVVRKLEEEGIINLGGGADEYVV